jgi:hypothetical protein
MIRSLINSLRSKGFAPQRLPNIGSDALLQSGWCIQGVFTEVDQGNRLKRTTIGFGQGATKMDVQISIQ